MAENNLFGEKHRPQFHFSARKNWLNDPNGLVYYKGEYHLFFQHNPKGLEWGPNTWGHAVSGDLVHWKQLEHAIEPYEPGWIWSGSAVVDTRNTAGFRSGGEDVLVAVYTAGDTIVKPEKPCAQFISYSNDRGRTWRHYDGNPVLAHIVENNRDPKVIWFEPERKWIMALFLSGNEYALFESPDLKRWKGLSTVHVPGGSECPDLFELVVDGDRNSRRWVFWAGNGNYLVGDFDGRHFRAEGGVKRADFGRNFYAAQSWYGLPEDDGRTIQIAWMAGGEYPGMPFNQQMSFPCELALESTSYGARMLRRPVAELAAIRRKKRSWQNAEIVHGENLLQDVSHDLLEIQACIDLGDAREVAFGVRGERIRYSRRDGRLSFVGCFADLQSQGNIIELQILVDRTSVEVFADGGRVCMSSCFLPDAERSFDLDAYGQPSRGGRRARVITMEVYELSSAYE
jgi:sucrose-6-phosphate hydrolase SacC (GH32 family)